MDLIREGALIWEPGRHSLKPPHLYFVTEVSSTEGVFLRGLGNGLERRLRPDTLPSGWHVLTPEETARLIVGSEDHFDTTPTRNHNGG